MESPLCERWEGRGQKGGQDSRAEGRRKGSGTASSGGVRVKGNWTFLSLSRVLRRLHGQDGQREGTPCTLQGSRIWGRGVRPLESGSRGADQRRAWVSELWECFSALLSGPWCTRVSLALRSGPPSAGAQNHLSPWGPGCLSVWLAGLSTRGSSAAAALPSRRGFLGVVEALGGGFCGPQSAEGRERPPLLGKHGGSPTPQPLRVGAARDPKAQCQLHHLQWEDGIGG